MIDIVEDTFGTYPGYEPGELPQTVRRFTMTNTVTGFSAQIINYGATITSIKVPQKSGQLEDVVLGFDDIDGYLTNTRPYFRGSIGRTANRIAKGHFILDGESIQVSQNDGENHLHGGFRGFDKKMWNATVNGSRVLFSYLCTDGEEGYPGDILAQAAFEVTANDELIIAYQAICSKPTPVGFTNHTYFNLSGHQNADKKMENHAVRIVADSITAVDAQSIITGVIQPVAGTKFDLTTPQNVNALLQTYPEGYDINYCLNPGQVINAGMHETVTGIIMELETDQPGMQFFTANSMPEPGTDPIIGKGGARYFKNGGFCFEAQNYPDAVNQPHFPSAILRPGDTHGHTTIYRFRLQE